MDCEHCNDAKVNHCQYCDGCRGCACTKEVCGLTLTPTECCGACCSCDWTGGDDDA